MGSALAAAVFAVDIFYAVPARVHDPCRTAKAVVDAQHLRRQASRS